MRVWLVVALIKQWSVEVRRRPSNRVKTWETQRIRRYCLFPPFSYRHIRCAKTAPDLRPPAASQLSSLVQVLRASSHLLGGTPLSSQYSLGRLRKFVHAATPLFLPRGYHTDRHPLGRRGMQIFQILRRWGTLASRSRSKVSWFSSEEVKCQLFSHDCFESTNKRLCQVSTYSTKSAFIFQGFLPRPSKILINHLPLLSVIFKTVFPHAI